MGEQHVVLGGPQCSGEDSAIVCELDVVIYISLIDGLCKMGELDFSIEMQILMVEKGMAPDVFTYISLIQGLSDAGLMDEALGLMQEMRGKGIVPNSVTYTTLINGFTQADRFRFGPSEHQ